jgi:hypothetical protein
MEKSIAPAVSLTRRLAMPPIVSSNSSSNLTRLRTDMGYRSNVVLSMNKAAFMLFMADLRGCSEELQGNVINMFGWCDEKSADQHGNILVSWSSIKWYDGYSGVDFIMDFINRIANEGADEDQIGGAPEVVFKRSGEESDDLVSIESQDFNNHFDIYFQTDINYNNSKNDDLPDDFFQKALGIEKEKENEHD